MSTVDATTSAAAGVGSPMKCFRSTLPTCTLKRASRSAPQVTYIVAVSQPQRPHGSSAQLHTSRPGATPKAIRSASESYCTPNELEVRVSRAIRPSSTSQNCATRIMIAARWKSPRSVQMVL
jgi:hypothetical protein